jgi:formiminotetrahydrofolate cyclodeaminase
VNENVQAFLKVLDPADRTTGGGTASAIAGAMAGALTTMVAKLSLGKKGMEPARSCTTPTGSNRANCTR